MALMRMTTAILAVSGALLLTSGAQATGTLDQQQTDTSGGIQFIDSEAAAAQTFTAGISGQLDQIDLFLAGPGPGGLTLVLLRGLPDGNGTFLTFTVIPAFSAPPEGAWLSIPIGPVAVSAGTQYTISFSAAAPDSGQGGGWFRASGDRDAYAGGDMWGGFGLGFGPAPGFDMAFKTYVASADTTPPEIECSASPETLWPPNHKLQPLDIDLSASDDSGSVDVNLLSVTSSQAESGLDPEDVPNDIRGWTTGADDRSGLLRAERFEAARTYSLTYRAEDPTGNSATCVATVMVPKSQKPTD